jgi:glyoxylase-like metal-dependent hydrolase (beta-lactamase superfamily II)
MDARIQALPFDPAALRGLSDKPLTSHHLAGSGRQSTRRAMTWWLVALALSLPALSSYALEVKFQPVADGVYAYIGDWGPRSVENEGLNANIGLVVTPAGAVLIDSGATFQSARKIDEAIKQVTEQPVRWVINTGGQDHRWLGNGYFQAKGAELIAHVSARADMQSRGGEQLNALRTLLGERADGTVPTLPTRLPIGSDTRLDLGGAVFELRHRGGGHTPGDIMVWLPEKNVLFAGDIVYVDRLLAVIPVSNTQYWLDTFRVIQVLHPQRIVPGHGSVTDEATARAQTRGYLEALRAHMRRAVDAGTDVSDAVKSFDGTPFMHLLNADELMAGNANRVYLEVERE